MIPSTPLHTISNSPRPSSLQSKPVNTFVKGQCWLCGYTNRQLENAPAGWCPHCIANEYSEIYEQNRTLDRLKPVGGSSGFGSADDPPMEVTRSALGKRKSEDSHNQPTKAIRNATEVSSPNTSPIPKAERCIEYQTEDDLLLSLRQYIDFSRTYQTPSYELSFKGSYSIIADPAVSRTERIRIVLGDVKKAINLHISSCPKSEKVDMTNVHTKVFSCHCHQSSVEPRFGPFQPPPPPSASIGAHITSFDPKLSATSAPPKKTKTQTKISNWFVSQTPNPKAAAADGTSPQEMEGRCSGFVQITIQPDVSHALGPKLKGQKITVVFQHSLQALEAAWRARF